ncbi:hypothetical protein B5F40_01025 [Gordonibacter sp. An230]|nr:hypothetical protein B5F40_01025 [Gordonibacter sp. An230]
MLRKTGGSCGTQAAARSRIAIRFGLRKACIRGLSQPAANWQLPARFRLACWAAVWFGQQG